jgi:hypothetical protein
MLGLFFAVFFGGMMILEASKNLVLWHWFLTLVSLILISVFFFIAQLYLQGYLVEMVKNVKEKKEDSIPLHKNIKTKFQFGWAHFVIGIGPMLLSTLLLLSSIAIIISGSVLIESETIVAIILIVLGILLTIISSFFLLFIIVLILPSMLYIFLETKSIRKAYCIKNIKLAVKEGWKGFLIIYAMSILGSTFTSTFGQIPGFGLLVITFGMIYLAFLRSFVLGKIFQDIDKLKLFK